MDITEVLGRVSTAIAENDLSTVIDDVQVLIGEIDNLNNTIVSLNTNIDELTTNNATLTNEIDMNRKTIANLVRQIPVKTASADSTTQKHVEYNKILEEMLKNA